MDFLNNINATKLTELAVTYGLKVLGFLVLLYITFKVAGGLERMSRRSFSKTNMEHALSSFLSKMVRYAVLVVGIISCLGIFGIQTASFAAVLAAAGFAVGMALQGTLGNFAAGVMLIIFKPFKIGDFVSVGGTSGTVKEIDLFSTVLDTPDNRRIIVPNGSVFGAEIENVSFHETRRVDVSVGTDYTADVDSTRAILLETAKKIPQALTDPEPAAVLTGLGASSIDWSVRVWVKSSDYWPAKDELTRSTKYALDSANVGIPYQTVDLNFTSDFPLPTDKMNAASTRATPQQ